MLTGVRGSLVSQYCAEQLLAERFAGRLGEDGRERARPVLGRIVRACRSLGPASGIRALFDVGAAPLAGLLGFRVTDVRPVQPKGSARTGRPTASDEGAAEIHLAGMLERDAARVSMLVTPWGHDLERAAHGSIPPGVRAGARWCLLFNARQIRLVDSLRLFGDEYLDFDLDTTCEDRPSFDLFWAVLRAEAFAPFDSPDTVRPELVEDTVRPQLVEETVRPELVEDTVRPELVEGRTATSRLCLLEEIVALSARHGLGVCRSLREGVLEALSALMQGVLTGAARRRITPAAAQLDSLFEQSLTIVYRILFLLFAEARRLVPTWHAVYRDAYSIEALRSAAEHGGRTAPVGFWETLKAISRLAHRGCRAGSLVVTPFNGRLFSPARTPLAESARLDDRAARQAVAALSTRPVGAGRHRARVAYRDLGVEQLGAVYENVLDYRPRVESIRDGRTIDAIVRLERGGGRRKATGTFYTPHPLTRYLVRRTLHPLVAGASAEDILRLRVLDPSMGSGAFLVAACYHLASCYERALVAEGTRHPGEIDERARTGFRRLIAQRCLFGVDVNPMAVQLARLSLWLATLAADRPLTFLDHHLGAGDSLVGASPLDVVRCPDPHAGRSRPVPHPGLFDADDLRADMERVLPERLRVALGPDDTVAAVRDKERAIERLSRPDGPLARWKDAADLWCACWFWHDADTPTRGVYHDLVDLLVGGQPCLPAAPARALLERARAIARSRAFFHWPIEFPEVFFDAAGRPHDAAGFDAVIGNPPWDMLRADRTAGTDDKDYDRALAGFARRSALYTAQGDGHSNRFQLFVERAFRLARPGGRLGLVVPWGFFSDRGCRELRRLLFEHADTDRLVGFDNAKAIFPIHRSVRFALVSATTGRPTARTICRFGEKDVAALDAMADGPDEPAAAWGTPAHGRAIGAPIVVSPALLARLSGDDLAVPDVRSSMDLEILEQVASAFPPLSSPRGWNARFGRELNASDDRRHLVEGGPGLPVVEGKHVEPFVVHLSRVTARIPGASARRLLGSDRAFERPRLAYRDVASATNRLTLIAAMLPAGCVTTHTLFCLKTPLDQASQWFLCALMNSYVMNYLVRLRVTTHVSAGIVERLPAPRTAAGTGPGCEIQRLARRMATPVPAAAGDRLQALVARLYALNAAQFSHILDTFPLVEEERRRGAYEEYLRL